MKTTRFVCQKCNGWLWTSGISGSTDDELIIIDDSLTCIDCDKSVRGKLIFHHYMRSGEIQWDEQDQCFIGKAQDGLWVNMGDSVENVERYLYDHPTPKTW